ncbi:MAG: metallophosphoesterase [bacterium]
MRRRDIIIFFSVVLGLYGLINFYIFSHGLSSLGAVSAVRPWYIGIFLFLSLAYIAGRFLERRSISRLSAALIWLGSFWLAAVVYFLLIVLAVDLVRLLDWIIPFLPEYFSAPQSKFAFGAGSTLLVVLIVVWGAINAARPRVRRLDLNIQKNASLRTLNVVAVSDIHLGTIICKARLERIVRKINLLDADIVLLPGDVVDEDIQPVIKQNLGETFRSIKSKYGVIAVTGNHEYIGGVDAACEYLVEHGIIMLRDDVIKIADSFYVVGREDRSFNRGPKRQRKTIEELMRGLDKSLPIILMDHQPFHLEEAAKNNIDLQISGHTHHGQLWPFNLITKRIFEVSWGYKKKGSTHFYVSCGVGSWGPPVRIGNRPEIMHIKITFAT